MYYNVHLFSNLIIEKQIDKAADGIQVPKGKYPIFFYGTHETLVQY